MTPARIAPWIPALTVLGLLTIGSALHIASPKAGGAVALVFPPWWSDARTMEAAAAAGSVLRVGLWHGVVVVRPDAAGTGDSGAWLRLNPIMAGCGDAA